MAAKGKTKIVWSATAVADLQGIAEYIRQDSPSAARKIKEEIIRKTRRLAKYPLSGAILSEFPGENYRQVPFGNYRIIYEPVAGEVEILTVLHVKRNLKLILQGRAQKPSDD
ncbi:MAG: type II toxin-antitoxin system RelE/ParE family toxin [Planctomycetota bacterium]|nr:type II toxin-antitoxin system RelE/ParE family toxin [Planctomycetota bacterium]